MKIYLSDVFHDAADVYLNPGNRRSCWESETYSCIAIYKACLKIQEYNMTDHVMTYVKQFGVLTNQRDQFRGVFTSDREMRQGARYLWLKMLAEVAESEGAYYDTSAKKIRYQKTVA